MTIYTPTNTPSRPEQNPGGGVQGAPDIVTRNLVTGYEWNQGNSLPHAMVDANWVALDTMAQSGQYWPLYTGLYLKNRGLDTEGGVFVDNPYNNGGVERFGVNYVNYRIPLEDSSFGVTLAQGDFLSYKGNLHLKNGDIKYGTEVSFVDSALDSAMAITGTDIFVGKGSTANPNASQFRIGKLGGTQVEVGSLNNILNQEVTLQVGAAGATVGTNLSGSIKAKQTQVSPPLWNLTLNSYNGTTGVEAITIAPSGAVTIPSLVGAGPDFDSAKINNLTAPGLVNLGTSGGSDTVIKGNLQVDGSIIGGGITVGVQSATLATTASNGLAVSQTSNTGAVTMNVNVDALNEIPLVTEVTSWNNLVGTAGGAAKADKLTTSRLIWGQSFNGTADVSGALTNVTSVTASGTNLELTSSNQVRLEASLAEYRFKSTSTPYGVLKFNTLTADRTYTMPDNSGTVALLSDLAASGVQLNVANTFTAMQTFSAGLTGDLTGNADTATTATDALALNGVTASITDNAKIVQRDASGNFTAGTITAALTGNASTATTATDALALNGDTASTTTNGDIVLRDASGNFTAGIITASLTGNADTVTDGVTMSTVQSITAEKTFTSKVNVSEEINFNGGVDAVIRQAGAGKKLEFYLKDYSDAATVLSIGNTGFGNLALFAIPVWASQIVATGDMQTNFNLTVGGNATVAGSITAGGDITAFFTSDKRLKDNIVPIPNALDKVASLSGNTFDWNDKTDKVGSETGVIAQEVQALGLPDVVTERENGYLAVRYEKLVPLLIEAIKELKAEVEELKA